MNKIELMGRLTSSVEIKKSKKDDKKTYAKFTLAVPRKLDKEKTDFIDCVAFGRMSETISKYVEKGQRIIVTGALQIDNYTDKDGNNRKSVVINVDDFYFIEYKKESEKKEDEDELPFG